MALTEFLRSVNYFSTQVFTDLYAAYSAVAGARRVMMIVIGCFDFTSTITFPLFVTLYVPSFVDTGDAKKTGGAELIPVNQGAPRLHRIGLGPR